MFVARNNLIINILRYSILAMPLFLCAPLIAEDKVFDDEVEIVGGSDVDLWQFREDYVDLPEYPKKESLLKLDIDAADSPFEYFIDSKSLSIGADEAVAYTVVIRSGTGTENILFETIRCDSREYKTHAYGTSKKTFYRMYEPQWKRIVGRGGTGKDYRRDLVVMYFCGDMKETLDKDSIMHRLYDPSNIPEESRGY